MCVFACHSSQQQFKMSGPWSLHNDNLSSTSEYIHGTYDVVCFFKTVKINMEYTPAAEFAGIWARVYSAETTTGCDTSVQNITVRFCGKREGEKQSVKVNK